MGKTDSLPSVDQVNASSITQQADKYWAPHSLQEHLKYDSSIIKDIYENKIFDSGFATKILECSQYLENYLWPNYDENADHVHIMSIAIMVNEKFRERVPAWKAFTARPEHFPHFFMRVLHDLLDDHVKTDVLDGKIKTKNLREKISLLLFLIHCFNSCEVDLIRVNTKRIVSLKNKKERNPKGIKDSQLIKFEREFFHKFIQDFYCILNLVESEEKAPKLSTELSESVHYCEHFLELLIDLETLPLTRRFCNILLDDSYIVVKCRLSNLVKRSEGRLFSQLLEILKFYSEFEVDEITGDPLSSNDIMLKRYSLFNSVQHAVFKKCPELKQFYLSNVANVDSREKLKSIFQPLKNEILHEIASFVKILPNINKAENLYDNEFLLEILISKLEKRDSQLEILKQMPLYPTEKNIWDENVIPLEYFASDGCLALPKLNLQFLTLHDYLYRNFRLFCLESTYEIRQDIEDAIQRLQPWKTDDKDMMFGGWARMAYPITDFSIIEVGKPNIGEKQPSRVMADVTVTMSTKHQMKKEWEALRKHDVCFLVTVKPEHLSGTAYDSKENFISQVGLAYVRGCEIEGMLGPTGKVIEDRSESKPEIEEDKRTFRVSLDCNQYRLDMLNTVGGKEDVYKTFNVVLRRKPKENNFKAVLETIQSLMNTKCVVPNWLHDVILGHKDPEAAHYSKIPNQIKEFDFNDTFLNINHLKSSFPNSIIEIPEIDPVKVISPFKIKFIPCDNEISKSKIIVTPHVLPNSGPYPHEQPKKNLVEFTPTQVEAIYSGMQLGLTVIIGPPGTGKTDIAVQIISNLYHNYPSQRTLIVTHSNQALNQLFEKIICLDIDERHLLRLGHGEESLETEKDFSRYGRVNFILAKRLELLKEVKNLQESLNVLGDVAFTCETANNFYSYHILARWEEFLCKVKQSTNKEPMESLVIKYFPFKNFFKNAPQPLFERKNLQDNMNVAEGCFRYIKNIFTQLEEFRAFELLHSGLDRSRYLLVKEAKVIAMTCTYAALKRKELVELGFTYDNILMEESAQILEIETFIPLLLQNPQDGFNRLKRWIMIGDHHQLPPVIKNMAFQKYSNMEQSLFTRWIPHKAASQSYHYWLKVVLVLGLLLGYFLLVKRNGFVKMTTSAIKF